MKKRKLREYSAVYLTGSLGYSLIELLWRGFTHWTMALTGGVCFLLLYLVNRRHPHENLLVKCLRGTYLITAIEFMVGCVVNLLLDWKVWDYSQSFGNIMGQICPLYSLLWFFLCIHVYHLAGKLHRLLRRKR